MKRFNQIILVIILLASSVVTYLNFLRYESFQVQYKMYNDGSDTAKLMKRDMDFINSINIDYPSIGLFTMPLSSLKGAYMLSKDSIYQAIKLHEKGIEQNPFLMYSEGQLADIYYRLGDMENFEKYTRYAFKNLPNNPLHFVFFARLLRQQNKNDSIIYYFEKVEDILGSKDPQVYNIVLSSLVLDKDTINKYGGKEIAARAIKIWPKKSKVIYDYIMYGKDEMERADKIHKEGGIKFNEGKYNEAIVLIKEAIDIYPNKQIYYDNYISANFNEKNYNKIVNIYDTYREKFSDIQPKIVFYVGFSLYNTNDFANGCELLRDLKDTNTFNFDMSIFPNCDITLN